MQKYPISQLTVTRDVSQKFYINGRQIIFDGYADEKPGALLDFRFYERDGENAQIEFEDEDTKVAFIYAQRGCITDTDHLLASIADNKSHIIAYREMIQQIVLHPFFKQLKGVDIKGVTKPKIYEYQNGPVVFMSNVAVEITEAEKVVFQELLDEAHEYFANWTDSDLTGIETNLVISKMFKLHFPENNQSRWYSSIGSLITYNKIQELL